MSSGSSQNNSEYNATQREVANLIRKRQSADSCGPSSPSTSSRQPHKRQTTSKASASVSSMGSTTPSSPGVRGRTTNSGKNNLKDQILHIFNVLPSDCLKPIEIAKNLGLKSAKDVNPTLYEMQKNGLLDKCGGTPPLWKLATDVSVGAEHSDNSRLMEGVDSFSHSTKEKTVSNSPIRSSGRSSNDTSREKSCISSSVGTRSQSEKQLESRILQVLTENPSSSLKSKDIAKLIGLETAKDVNPTLYRMKENGLIDKDQGETPAWKQADHQTGVSDLGRSLGKVKLRPPASGEGNQYPLDSQFLREYDSITKLGSGGFGEVFKATLKLTGTQYAVKRIELENSERAKKKAVKEVKALEKMEHPNIVRYFSAWLEGPRPAGDQNTDVSDTESDTTSSAASAQSKSSSQSTTSSQTRGSTKGEKDSILFDKGRRSEGSDDLDIVFDGSSGAGDEPRQESEADTSEDTYWLPGQSPGDSQDTSPPPGCVCLYIQMELCQESTLADWLLDNPEKDREEMLIYFKQIVDAVDHIHSLKLFHRDLKPNNIFFSMDGLLKIGDFGLVTAEEHSSSCGEGDRKVVKHTQGAGTRYYKSPEQCSGDVYTQKVDIYALGVIFVEIMSSFSSEMERRTQLEKLKTSKIDFLKQFHKDYPTGRSFVAPLLADDPGERPTAKVMLTNPLLRPKPKVAKQYLSH